MSLKIAIDFDGTCTTHAYPEIGKDIGAVPVLKELVEVGHKLILFTMRDKEELRAAEEWFARNGIELWFSQTDPEQAKWTESPKAYGHLCIDDRNLGTPLISPEGERPYVDWQACERLLREQGVLPTIQGLPVTDEGSE